MEYANSSNTIFTLNYTGVVNYYYYDQNNNQVALSFQCKNANFRIDSVGNIYWKSGQFVCGQWYNGQWKNETTNDNGQTWEQSQQIVSFWKDGIWHNGKFHNGQWENGFFNEGNFYFGYWLDGVFGYKTLIQQDAVAYWHDGYFYGGVFSGTVWYNGVFHTNSDIKSYWMVKDRDNYLTWQGGSINGQISNVSPPQTVYNNGQYFSVSGKITFLKITQSSYKQFEFVCANAYFSVDTIGIVNISSGNYYNGQFKNIVINNSMLSGFDLQQCTINNCNISQSILLNCTITNNGEYVISDCQWYNGYLSGGTIKNSIWYDGVFDCGNFDNSIWYDGQWNKDKNNSSHWLTTSQWYGGQWYGGYVDSEWSDISPYIVGNGKTYDMFTGQLMYYYKDVGYVLQLQNAGIQIDVDGTILFVGGVWEDGVFNTGNFINSEFNNGTFISGNFENSTWNNGNFNGGVFYTSVWNNGNFNGGVFRRSDWYNGNFFGGQFESGNWYDGYFNGGNWVTLNSFWFDGVWVGGTQNGVVPSNYSKQTYVVYLTNNQLTNNIYIVQLNQNNFKIQLYDFQGKKIQLQVVNSYQQCDNIGYFIKDGNLHLCFKKEITNYYKLSYTYVLSDSAPQIKLIDDYLQYLQQNTKHLISGEFTYIVTKQDQQKEYYSIRVQNANFNIQNGFITWYNGIFQDGIWYNGQWNANTTELFQLVQPMQQDLLLQIEKCIWHNGIWMNGNWNYDNSQWQNGQWLTGTINGISSNIAPNFQLGNGKNYTNYHGLLKYIYTDEKDIKHFGSLQFDDCDFQILADGYIIVNKGNLTNGYWYNGQWFGDNWYNGIWYNGTWNCGTWHNGTWNNGTWKLTVINADDIDKVQYKPGNYRNVGVKYVISQQQIPLSGFFIGETIQYDSSNNSNNSDNSNSYFDQWTDEQYQGFYGNSLNDISDSSSSNSSYITNTEGLIAVPVKKWVDSVWEEGFIKDIKSFYAPMYGVANQNQYKDYTQDLLYYYPMYDENGQFLYNQYFFIRCQDASFKVDKSGNIHWYGGRMLNGQWRNGQWYNGLFINGQWHDGYWYNGQFTSGVWHDGYWYNGYITTSNLTWHKGQWVVGYIDYKKSYCSPQLYTANNHLFINYTGVLKYYNILKNHYYKIDVQNACFSVSLNGDITFYNGTWKDGTFIGYWLTAQFDQTNYQYMIPQVIIKMNQVYTYRKGSVTMTYKVNFDSQMYNSEDNLTNYLLDSNGKQQKVSLFTSTKSYISIWLDGTFSYGTWYNGEWVDGEWGTQDDETQDDETQDDETQDDRKWITGIINGIVEEYPPSYQIISDEKDFYHFANFTGRVKYKVNFFNDQTLKITDYFTTFRCQNAYFDIKYEEMKKSGKTYKQVLIIWQDGLWKSGTWHHGVWHKGTWISGTWEKGLWLNGTWQNGTWISGTWYNGRWENGEKKRISILNMIYN